MAIAVIVVATVLRLVVAVLLPVAEDEAYAIGIARQFSLSYFDHPPLHFWLVGAWAKLWGSEAIWLLRLPFVALGAISSWLMFVLSRRLFGEVVGLRAVVLFNVAPVFGAAHSTLVLPDGPLLAASLGVAVVLSRLAFEGNTSRRLGPWLEVGVLAGLALLSKYHGVLLIAGAFAFLLTTPQRRWLVTPGPWLAAVIAVLMFSPVVIWNWQHDWASFAFQSGRSGGSGLKLAGLLQSLAGQAVYLVPWVFLALVVVLVRAWIGGPRREARWFLACLSTLPIVIFTAVTLRNPGLPHWPMPGWVFVIPLLAEALTELRPMLRRIGKVVIGLTAVAVVALVGVGIAQARWGIFELGKDPTAMLQSWDELREELALRGLPADDRTFIASSNWWRTGELNYVFGRDIPVLCLCSDKRHFAYQQDLSEYAGWTGIFIDAPNALKDDGKVPDFFAAITPTEEVSLTKAGRPVVPLGMRIGSGFLPP